jgi:DMSO/TMAO reductase YedYZ molybdopterin-dependent catalytic subunit
VTRTARSSEARTDRWLARLAGLASAGVALGIGELVGAMATPSQSLVGSVGGEIIDNAPGFLVRGAIDTLGTADKPVLLTLVVLVCLGLGALVGPAARSRPWVGPVAFSAAGLVGMAAGLADPLADDTVTVVASVLAVVAGSGSLALLLRLLPEPSLAPVVGGDAAVDEASPAIPRPGRARGSRRAFLAWTGVAGAAGAVAALGGRSMRGTSPTEVARVAVQLPPPSSTLPGPTSVADGAAQGLAVEGLTPLITPNDSFYRIDTALLLPQADISDWRLEIRGDVERPLSLSYDDLLAMPQVAAPVTIACVSNEVGGDLIGTAVWQGVPLDALLEQAGVRPGGEQIVGRSLDDFTVGFPTEVARDGRTALVALGMNGEPLPIIHGFPARLIVEGLYGYVSATKWLKAIELRGWDDYDAYWIGLGWAKEGPIKTQSRIDVPRAAKDLTAGTTYALAGVAWAPGRGISKVEVQVDDGPWLEAELGAATTDATWRQWVHQWEPTAGRHRVRVRATDGDGVLQTEDDAPPEPDGATGYHLKIYKVAG